MSNTVINAKIIDQKVQLTNIPLIASGSQGVLQIKCTFDALWAGYQTTAVFFREEKAKVTDVFHVPVYLGLADVPHEVLKEEGVFFLSFMGVAENIRTTVAVSLEVKRGAITEGTSVPDPTPDVYTPLLEILNQSGIIPDATLTQEGKAADAKATGEAIQKTTQSINKITEETIPTMMEDLQAADRIIERGVEPSTDSYPGDWYWEKWESGKAACYGLFDFGDIKISTSWGNMYQCGSLTKDFPADLFIDVPVWDLSVAKAEGGAFVVQQYANDSTAANTGKFYLARPTSFTMTGVVLGFHAIGRWKTDKETAEASAETE